MPEIKSWIKNIAPNAQDSDCVTTTTAFSQFTTPNGVTISSTTTSFFPKSCQNNDHCEPGTTCLKTNTCGLCKTKKDCKEHQICLSSISGPGAAKNGKCDFYFYLLKGKFRGWAQKCAQSSVYRKHV